MFQTNCSSVLKMPIDLALPLFLSQEELGYRKASEPRLNPCLRFERMNSLDQTTSADRASPNHRTRKAPKQVSFADHKGLSLTKVKIFSEANDPIEIPLNVREMLDSALKLTAAEDKLVLDFTQPSADYLRFCQRLEDDRVCLEHCMLKDNVLAGTVKVKNLSYEKSVTVRVTFDAWKSHVDVNCSYVKKTYPDSEHDAFSFDVLLPGQIKPHEHVEFAVRYQVADCLYWDSNQGKNYKITWSSLRSERDLYNQGGISSGLGIHFDRYGSPTCSHGIFPDWPSYTAYGNVGPYY